MEDYESGRYDFDPKDAEFVIRIIENTICHQQGEDKEGTPLRGNTVSSYGRSINLSFIIF